MHICFFTLTMNTGGTERVIANLSNQLTGHEVSIVCCLPGTPKFQLQSHVHYHTFNSPVPASYPGKLRTFFLRKKQLERYVSRFTPDIIVAFLPEPCFLAASVRRKVKIPVIVSVRADPHTEYKFLPYRLLMRFLFPKADGFVFQTEEAKAYFPEKVQKKAAVIPNPIHPNACRASFRGERKKEITAVGRLVKEKNYPFLLDAFQELHQMFPEYVLRIFGEGEEREKIAERISDLGLKDHVILMGNVDNVFDQIDRSSCYILASSSEGMPNSLMEAMALGIPVVSTDCPCGGPRALIQNEVNGLLVPNGDKEALVRAAARILSERDLSDRIGNRASEITRKFNAEVIFGLWEDYIRKVVGKGKMEKTGVKRSQEKRE